MSDIRPSFPSLEGASGEGAVLRSVQVGESVASKNGSLALNSTDSAGNAIPAPVRTAGEAPTTAIPVMAFIDSSGNLVYPQLTSGGQIMVSTQNATGNGKKARGTAVGSLTNVTVASLSLTASKIYDDLDFIVSCIRDAIFQVILSDNGVETIIADAVVGPGQTSFHASMREAEITAGATGTQLLLIKALNLNSLSDFRAALSVNQAN